jgi:hypothetical protein
MKILTTHLLASALVGLPVAASACGLDGAAMDSRAFSAAHPGSIDVALGVRELIDQQRLAPLPEASPEAVHHRVEETLDTLRARLESAGPQSPTAIFLVDQGHWARWQRAGGALDMQLHVDGPQPGDVVILTSESVLAAVLAGRLTFEQARIAGAYALQHGSEPTVEERLASGVK